MRSILMILCLGLTSEAITDDRPPNILFAIADDWGNHYGAQGTTWVKTPAVDQVARQGLRFTRAFTPNAKCAPSRACLLTGRNSWQLKEAANHICFFPSDFKTWMEALREANWFVGHTTKGWGPGVAKDATGKTREMTGQAFNSRRAVPPAKGIGSSDYASNFTDFLDAAPQNSPWCFWFGAVEPHREYEFGSGLAKTGKKLSDIDHVPGYWPDNETVRQDMLDYAYEIEHFDRHLGRMLAELEKRGQSANTLVIVTSDHGMPFPRCKGSAYHDSNHIPFVAMWPNGIKASNRVIDDYVSFIDVAPTVMEVAGLKWDATGMAATPGRSLVPLFTTDSTGQIDAQRDHVLVGMERHDIGRPLDVGYPIRGIIKNDVLFLQNFEPTRWPACNPETGYLNVDASPTKSFILQAHRRDSKDRSWMLCFGKRPAVELYDLKSDPHCVNNLAASNSSLELCDQLRAELTTELQQQGDPRMEGQGSIFDEYPHSDTRHTGFYERYLRGELKVPGWVAATDFETADFEK